MTRRAAVAFGLVGMLVLALGVVVATGRRTVGAHRTDAVARGPLPRPAEAGAESHALADLLAASGRSALDQAAPPAGRAAAGTPMRGSGLVAVRVYLPDPAAFAAGRIPFVRPVLRQVPADAVLARTLAALLAGPTAAERARGLGGLSPAVQGPARVSMTDGRADVRLTRCTVAPAVPAAQAIQATLRQFPDVAFVQVYDGNGATEHPGEYRGDTLPRCLDLRPGAPRYLDTLYQ